jgi:hypothetical protein
MVIVQGRGKARVRIREGVNYIERVKDSVMVRVRVRSPVESIQHPRLGLKGRFRVKVKIRFRD